MEGWYRGYALQGVVVLGTAPILLPLLVEDAASATEAGLVVAALYLGKMSAPIWGSLADRTGRHGLLFLGGIAIVAAALTRGVGFWMPLALLLGVGAAAGATLTGILIVEHKPREEWDARIGWLQTFYGVGWMIGLGLASWLNADPRTGLLISAGLLLPAVAVGRIGLPAGRTRAASHTSILAHAGHLHVPRADEVLGHFHRASLGAIQHLSRNIRGDYGLYLTGWFFASFGAGAVFGLYPLLMDRAYGIDAGPSAIYFAIAVGAGIFLYAPAGALSERLGNLLVLTLGQGVTVVATAGLALLALLELSAASWLAPALFFLLPTAWSLRIVAGTGLAVHLATFPKGQALGLFNGATALANVLGAVAAGCFADTLGYESIPVLAAAATLIGALYLIPLPSILEARGS